MKTPITRQGIRNHLTYAWWKYLLLICAAVFGWNIFYTVTRYRPPEEKKIVMNLYTYADQYALNDYMAKVNATLMPEMEEMTAVYNSLDDTYGAMIFSTHIAVSEGDIYLLDREYFQRHASSGVFLPLEDQEELMAMLEEAGVSLSQGWRAMTDTGERHLFAIPCAALPGFTAFTPDPSDDYLCVLYNNQNDENVLKFLNIFIADMLKDPVAAE